MRDFKYLTPSTMEQALTMLTQTRARPMAGGTDLLISMRAGVAAPRYLVDLTGLGLSYVREDAGVIKIGAVTTLGELLESELVQMKLPVLVEAVAQIGVTQTRNLATIGGNLCSAVPSADCAPPLLVLDACLRIADRSGERMLALEQFFAGAKKTILKQDELLVEIRVPLPPPRTGVSFLKLGRRQGSTLAVVNVAARVSLAVDGRVVEDVRIALGAVAPTPVRTRRCEAILQGGRISQSLIDDAASIAVSEIEPISDLRATAEYRRDVSRVLVGRALANAWHRAAAKEGNE